MRYPDLRTLLANELAKEEDESTVRLIRDLRGVRKRGWLTKGELLAICQWKSPRAIRLCQENSPSEIKKLSAQAFGTRSERVRFEALTKLRGVGAPMASSILMLTNPQRYGVLDIRVWQLLFDLKSVHKKPRGIGFDFKNWYHYLVKLRYHAKELKVSVRCVERSLFLYHKKNQRGTLYGGRPLKMGLQPFASLAAATVNYK